MKYHRKVPFAVILTLSLALSGCGANDKTSGNQNPGNPLNATQNNTGQTSTGAGTSETTNTPGGGTTGGSTSDNGTKGGGAYGSGPSTGDGSQVNRSGPGTDAAEGSGKDAQNGNNQSVTQGAPASEQGLTVIVTDAKMNKLGTAQLTSDPKGVAIKLDLTGLPPGAHGIHIHQNARCDAPDFKTAGEHFNPNGQKHGLENGEGPHAGDLPSITADKDGKVSTTLVSTGLTLSPGKSNSLLEGDGKSLIIHANPDDNKTDPSGNSGGRIACGLINGK
ncbi:superoxide dismutase family protein [Paenibacillus caseinilyticus]|uniref:Superoxide dismutase [Cu-Zn] n=1 Tax=Paenibacillus mucilaginosus K02 TaxID=997761 RepID=I0BNY2_9BACL|nr:superoxide dismutase family protein [Paenibacillus mucilaginosus]AFH64079.1 superoxide dismutase [Paenibacillus mucilaginosus K02]